MVQHHGFTRLYIAQPAQCLDRKDGACSAAPTVPSNDIAHHFECAHSLLTHVTTRWQHRWVTTDVWNEAILEEFIRRPFFILVSVDAPVSLRWRRLKDRYRLEITF